jgi:hypothetical protein
MFQPTRRRISEKIKSTLDSDALPFHEKRTCKANLAVTRSRIVTSEKWRRADDAAQHRRTEFWEDRKPNGAARWKWGASVAGCDGPYRLAALRSMRAEPPPIDQRRASNES